MFYNVLLYNMLEIIVIHIILCDINLKKTKNIRFSMVFIFEM